MLPVVQLSTPVSALACQQRKGLAPVRVHLIHNVSHGPEHSTSTHFSSLGLTRLLTHFPREGEMICPEHALNSAFKEVAYSRTLYLQEGISV